MNPAKGESLYTARQINTSRILWNDGKTTRQIAALLTVLTDRPVSRDAVIGLARRQGFTPRPSPIRRGA